MSSQRRRYTLKARAEQQAETRRRIVEATAALHEEVGPARTTVAEIARRAGVQRLTVYNNFPDEKELFAACGDHWLAQNPPPDLYGVFAIEDPAERLRAVLRLFYGWYRNTARASQNMQRDRLVMPALDAVMRIRMDQELSNLVDTLAAGFAPAAHSTKGLRATVALALDFWTWRRLSKEGLSDDAAADLMVDSAKAAARGNSCYAVQPPSTTSTEPVT
jgi:AcrR family transcriptional regulator